MKKIMRQEIHPDFIEEIEAATSGTEDAYYDRITHQKYRDTLSNTDYFITFVPNKDADGKLIKLEHGFQNDTMNSGTGETARNFANRNGASLATNASIFDVASGLIKGVQIKDGAIYQDKGGTNSYTLGIKADNTLVTYAPTVSGATILADGCVNALTGFFPLILNSVAVDPAVYALASSKDEPHPRNVIAQLPNNDLVFLTCEGRTSANTGMTYADLIRILLARGVKTAYNLDGGGSGQMVIRGVMINNPIDDNGKTERPVPDFLYIAKPPEYTKKFKTISKDLGDVNKRVLDLAADFLGLNKLLARPDTVTDLNALRVTNLYWCLGGAVGAPTTASSWGVIHWQPQEQAAMQIAFPYHATTGSIMLRRTVNDMTAWTAWRAM
jgi:exopolysaccharide biosynthesis protein